MTMIRFNNRPATKSFNNLMDDFFTSMPSFFREDFSPEKQVVPVNISETEGGYKLEFFAPGFEKEQFSISVENGMLTVEGKKEENEETKNNKTIRKEYKVLSFKRSFTLDENINPDGIGASYQNGILTLNLPKKEEVKPAAKQISVQ